ncbi:MAG: toll/interleukin-1 receptor domain-containing protein [Anaerolineaceae bacterium]|nr:toll/interleukin-1 receptor domain-containing protein [Anaerolineaceae bacterium]
MSQIFICYSRVDLTITDHLARLLRKAYSHVWFDENLHGGEEWWAEITKEVTRCQHFIFMMSEESLRSEWCVRELEEARQLRKHIVPILVRARVQVPEALEKIQHIDMSAGITLEGLNLLYATLVRYMEDERSGGRVGTADRRQLERLWLFINGRYIEVLNQQVQHGKIDWELYTAHVSKYLDLRSKSRSGFVHTALEESFESFDDALIRLDGQIGWTYELAEITGRPFMTEPSTASNDTYWFEKYQRLVRRAGDVWMRHAELVTSIRRVLPDFDVLKDY